MKQYFSKAPVSVQERLAKAIQMGTKVEEAKATKEEQIKVDDNENFVPKANVVSNGKKIVLDWNPFTKSTENVIKSTPAASNFSTLTWSSDEE